MGGLTLEDLLEVAQRTVGPDVRVRDIGLLAAALARVETRARCPADREDQPTILMHSLATPAPLAYDSSALRRGCHGGLSRPEGRPSALTDARMIVLVTDALTGRLESVRGIAGRLLGEA